MRAFRQTRETLCGEAVLAWLGRDNPAALAVTAAAQREGYARDGFWCVTRRILRAVGMRLERPVGLQDGEAVIAQLPDGRAVLGLLGPRGSVVIAASGIVRCEFAPVLMVIRKG